MNQLSVIIPFLNEGDEVCKTVENIRQTSGDEIKIILINDASTDGYDYRSVSKQFDAIYIEHEKRQGVASSRDEGIEISDSEYFLLLDGHMRFEERGWSEKFIQALESDSRAVFCGQTKQLSLNTGNATEAQRRPNSYGAYIDFEEKKWKALWNYKDPDATQSIIDIPIIYGASYACCKTFWKELGGLEGLIIYGMDEQFISIKAWLSGGRCKLLKDVVVEHLYRKVFPYPMGYFHKVYNEIFLTELLLPEDLKDSFFDEIIKISPKKLAIRAIEDLIAKEDWIKERKEYYKLLFKFPFEFILLQNKKIKDMQKK